jgi:hypothetical protein
MQPDLLIQRAIHDVHDLLRTRRNGARTLTEERTVLCIHLLVGKEDIRQAMEKADTAPCFALREVKNVLGQHQRAKTTIDQLWRIIEQLDFTPGVTYRVIWKKPSTRPE